jgi:uncharacterized repeat protein (TIGR03847 family)
MSDSFEIVGPQSFGAGTVGPAGQRAFYVQALTEHGPVSLKLEKGQVQALASAVDQLLERVQPDAKGSRPEDLVEPVNPAWTVAALGVGWDEANDRVVVVAQELVPEEDEGQEPAEARFHLSADQARGFVEHAVFLIEYGREFGRQNGHKRRS